jgi:hypothetical protein
MVEEGKERIDNLPSRQTGELDKAVRKIITNEEIENVFFELTEGHN